VYTKSKNYCYFHTRSGDQLSNFVKYVLVKELYL